MSNFWGQFFYVLGGKKHQITKKNIVAFALKICIKWSLKKSKINYDFKQELSPQNGRYTPLLCFHLDQMDLKCMRYEFLEFISETTEVCMIWMWGFQRNFGPIVQAAERIIHAMRDNVLLSGNTLCITGI